MSIRNHHVTPGELAIIRDLSAPANVEPEIRTISTTLANLQNEINQLNRAITSPIDIHIIGAANQNHQEEISITGFNATWIQLSGADNHAAIHTIGDLRISRCGWVAIIGQLRFHRTAPAGTPELKCPSPS